MLSKLRVDKKITARKSTRIRESRINGNYCETVHQRMTIKQVFVQPKDDTLKTGT